MSVSTPCRAFPELPSSLGGAWLAGLWVMLLLGPLLMCLAITDHSLAWQGQLSKARGEWKDGLWGPHPTEKVGCVSL